MRATAQLHTAGWCNMLGYAKNGDTSFFTEFVSKRCSCFVLVISQFTPSWVALPPPSGGVWEAASGPPPSPPRPRLDEQVSCVGVDEIHEEFFRSPRETPRPLWGWASRIAAGWRRHAGPGIRPGRRGRWPIWIRNWDLFAKTTMVSPSSSTATAWSRRIPDPQQVQDLADGAVVPVEAD
jgi:hypothetical protein